MQFNRIRSSQIVAMLALTVFSSYGVAVTLASSPMQRMSSDTSTDAYNTEAQIVVQGCWAIADGGNGHSYFAMTMPGGLNWLEAKAIAEGMGGYLATLTSAEESDWVYANVVSDPCLWNAEAGAYIGGFQNLDSPEYSEPGGGWEWVTGEPWDFENWGAGQPDNAHPGEHWLHFFNRNAAACPRCADNFPCGPLDAWNDIYLVDNWPEFFIVEFDFLQDCPELLVEGCWAFNDGGNGHRYEAFTVTGGVSWLQAKAIAEAMGGYLATLTDEAESNWVYTNIASEPCLWRAEAGPWIGGFQNPKSPEYSEPAGGWEWCTGEPWNFENWGGPNQPDNAPCGPECDENYLHFWNFDAAQCAPCNDEPPCGAFNSWNDIWEDSGNWIEAFIVEFDGAGRTCPSDLNGDGVVGFPDILVLLSAWGSCDCCAEDIVEDGTINFVDLVRLLSDWGDCG